jgi:choline dehydrogenase-like flavoprotein
MKADVLIVGSGPGGVNAAVPLVDAGCRVTLLDFGNSEDQYAGLIPPKPFAELRRTDAGQHRYFLGDQFEGVPHGKTRVGAQLTPPRQYVHKDVAERLPVISESFSAMESLASGGLGNAWGAGVFPFAAGELARIGIPAAALAPHYDAVAARIGVSGPRDDLTPFLCDGPAYLPPLEPDSNAAALLHRYAQCRGRLRRRGFFLGQTRLAVCTRAHAGRGPHRYHDMEFWSDADRSVYRPRWTLQELMARPNFRYVDRCLVQAFQESAAGGVSVVASHADTGERRDFVGDALILAAGTLGTARIVLRSANAFGVRLPLLCNPYTYVPALNLNALGREPRDARCSLAQLTSLLVPGDEPEVPVQTQVYSYRSLLAFKLLKESPLGYRVSLHLLRYLMSSLAILAINHADRPTAAKYCALQPGCGGRPDRLHIDYRLSRDEQRRMDRNESAILKAFLSLGCVPVRRIRPGNGSSIHYAGTLPIAPGGGAYTCDPQCRLHGNRSVYVADGSVFGHLPAKGLTFTIMANADRVGKAVTVRLANTTGGLAA